MSFPILKYAYHVIDFILPLALVAMTNYLT